MKSSYEKFKFAATGPKENDFPKAGIKVKFLLDEFLKAAKTIGDISDLTTGEVRVQFIMPLTGKTKTSYCQLLKSQGHWAYVEDPDAFISHAHCHKFKDFLSALEWKFCDEPEASVWLDLFSINQHEPMEWTFDWLSNTFRSNVAGIGRTIMVMSPWDNPYPYSRTWCIFETFATIAGGGKFEIALSKADEEAFLYEIQGVLADEKLDAMMATIRAENSECSVESDRVSIYKIIRETIGFDKLDTILFECYRKWVIDVAVHALDICLDKDHRLGLYFSICQLYWQQGNYGQAVYYARQGLDASKDAYGEDDLDTVNMLGNLANALCKQGKHNEAVIAYQQCLGKKKAILGDDVPGTLDTMNNLAFALYKKRQYSKASEQYNKCLDRRKIILGEDHPDTLMSMNGLAGALKKQGRHTEAIDLYQLCLERQQVVLGEDHPETLGVMCNLALALDDQGRHKEAIELYQLCLNREKVVLGEDHPNALNTLNNLAVAIHNQGRYDEAAALHLNCLNSRKIALGEEHPATLVSMDNLAAALTAGLQGWSV